MSTNAIAKAKERFPQFFDDFFSPWTNWAGGRWPQDPAITVPAVNITEETEGYKVTMAVPGMKKEDFDVDINGNVMTISAATEEESEDKDKNYTRKEYNYSSFSRSFTLPAEVNKEKIEARYDNGVLTVALPKKETAKEQNGKNIVVN